MRFPAYTVGMDALAGLIAIVVGAVSVLVSHARGPLPLRLPDSDTAQVHLLIGGDMMFDRTVRETMDTKGGDFLFSCIDPVLSHADIVLANLEGPITEHASESVGSEPGDDRNFTFTFSPSVAKLLFAHNISAVGLGNNHILNFGQSGASSTLSFLAQAGVGGFGDPLAHRVLGTDVRGIRLAFVGYNEFDPMGTREAASTTMEGVARARGKGYMPVVLAHWGEEYATSSNALQRRYAHAFVDAGAALVVGAHPHVVQESETYRGIPIYYSLGNFIFDQYWNEDVRHGLLLKVLLTPDGVMRVEKIPVHLERDRRTCPLEVSDV